MLNEKNKTTSNIVKAMCVILAVAAVFSFVSNIFAQDSKAENSSFRTSKTAIIRGSENVPRIKAGEFLMNIWKNTGIYQIIHTDTPEEIAAKQAACPASGTTTDD